MATSCRPTGDRLFPTPEVTARQADFQPLLAWPPAVPWSMLAVRRTAPKAVLAAVVAEFLMGTDRLGYMFGKSAGEFDTERAFASSLFATITSVAGVGLAHAAERRILRRWVCARRHTKIIRTPL